MSNVAKLKKQAAELELKKQFDKALAIYVKLLDSFDQNADELDVALFNRVGDLMLRQGSVADAVDYYEKAVDRYADTGFFNNAIALCNKILRHSPGRATVYYKLGKISAQKGFKNDAKVNFLEYADRMQKAGKVEEAFRALKEFADLCPDQDEVRLMLADQLTKAGKKAEAIEQFQTLYERYASEGRDAEAAATADRIHAIDPDIELRAGAEQTYKSSSPDLIFLDLDAPTPPLEDVPRVSTPMSSRPTVISELINEPVLEAPDEYEAPAARASLELTRIGDDTLALDPNSAGSLLGLESTQLAGTDDDALGSASPLDFEPTSLGLEPTSLAEPETASLDVEPTSLAEPEPPAASPPRSSDAVTPPRASTPASPSFLVDLDIIDIDAPDNDAPDNDAPDNDSPQSFGDLETPTPSRSSRSMPTPATPTEAVDSNLDLIMPDTEPASPPGPMRPTPRTTRAALEGLPMMDLDGPSDIQESSSSAMTADASTDAFAGPDDDEARSSTANQANADDFITLDVGGETEPAEEADAKPVAAESASVAGDDTGSSTERDVVDGIGIANSNEQEIGAPDADADAEDAAAQAASAHADDTILDSNEGAVVGGAEALSDRADASIDSAIDSAVDDALTPLSTAAISAGRRSTMVAAHSAEILRASVEGEPENSSLRRQFAEALLDAGDREGGIKELESAMASAERAGDLDLASGVAEEIARLEPDAVRHHQKRVEYAFRTSDRSRLIEAYLGLADALLRSDQPDKSRAVYQRVLDLAPDDVRAKAALDTIVVPPPPEPTPTPAGRASTQRRVSSVQQISKDPAPETADGFVNLGDWLRDDEAPKDTRMVVAEEEPTGDEDADFADMLKKFKQGVADNVDAEDYQSHYDLAIAFKEMGLLDEAIAEFQKALGSPTNRVPTYESLGQCFMEKKQFKLASSILGRALIEGMSDDKLIGVLYLLGVSAESQGNHTDALAYYQRVFIVDIQFRDIADRLSGAERAAK